MGAEQLLLFTVVIPALGAVLILLAGSRPNLRETITLLGSILLFLTVVTLYQGFATGEQPVLDLFQPLPGLRIALTVEALGLLFALIASFLWVLTSVYAIGYMRTNKEGNQTRFFACFAIAIAATMGVAFSANLFTLFLFYEILTLSTYPLVTHSQSDEARRAGRVYLGILLGASFALFLPAIVWTWVVAGQVTFTPGGILDGNAGHGAILALLLLYVFGIGKAAVMPFHAWLPAAMVAPTPVSALLHAVAVVKAGVFSIVKIVVYIFGRETLVAAGVTDWLVYIAGFTIVMASLVALYQDNLKKRLAYSTISQLSYVVVAAFLIAPVSILAAALHIAAHAAGKITLFFAAGAIYTAHHKTEVSQLNGIGRQMPLTMTAFAIATLSMIGVPPTVGFISKWYLLGGAIEMQNYFAMGIIVISTLLNAAYFLPIVHAAFFRDGDNTSIHEAPRTMVVPIMLTSLTCIVLFCFPHGLLELVNQIRY